MKPSALPGSPPPELVAFMETFQLPEDETLGQFLNRFDGLMNAVTVPTPDAHEVVIREVAGWRVRGAIWRSPGAVNAPVVLHLHGGGWTVGNHLTHRGFAAELVAAGFLVVSVDYRRAPRHRFPAAFDDCRAALGWCIDHIARFGGDPTRIAIAGDSAGANLAAAVAADDSALVTSAVLLSGIFDYHQGLECLAHLLGGGPTAQVYLEPQDFDSLRGDPRLSPIHGAARFPRTYIGVGERDPLLAESQRLHAALEAAGVPHVYDELPGAPHNYIQLPGHPSYGPGLERIQRFLERELTSPKS